MGRSVFVVQARTGTCLPLAAFSHMCVTIPAGSPTRLHVLYARFGDDGTFNSPAIHCLIRVQESGTYGLGILLALRHHDRVRRIGLRIPALSLRELIMAMGKQLLILERVYIVPLTEDNVILFFLKHFKRCTSPRRS